MKIFAAVALSLVASVASAHDAPPKTQPAASPPATSAPKAPSATPSPVKSHSGGTDAQGCHTNSQTGEYHCHRPK